ncbi:TfoX/Sxy family protein [Patulibacter defluvii]|uniref:TfoX/Sxy family protein n=1 Tax=Patulibacter defluvii TaxID=3095358 RepID=UPI002A75EEF3|nr:TfoX/Sxy family protein [Patulibacter sp. DM4]
MALDPELVLRLMELLADEPDVGEKRMFGGHAFLVGGHLTVAASRTGGLLVRVDPDEAPALLERDGVEPMVMRGREMRNWLHVAPEAIATKRQLQPWVRRAVTFVRGL